MSFFKDENGNSSSKRLVGILGAISLFATLLIKPNDTLVVTIGAMVVGALGISGMEKILKK